MLKTKRLSIVFCFFTFTLTSFDLIASREIFCINAKSPNVAISKYAANEDFEIIEDPSGTSPNQHMQKMSLKLKLKNGLQALLISDPHVVQSAVGLSVSAGSWHNPCDMPGLAHFVEHLVFMGSAKYPSEAGFSRYVTERGGEYNAFTAHDRTVYGFSINHEGLEGGLDRLSRFFIDPLFSLSAIEREKYSVHHEFEDNIENDALKVWRVLKATGNQKHPNAVFSCGNLDSLFQVTQKHIKQWHARYYIPSRMSLVIISSLPLQDLVTFATNSFASVPPSDSSVDNSSGPILTEDQKGHLILVEPSYQNRSMQLLWEIPEKFFIGNHCSPVELLERAFNYQGEGSLVHLLADKDLAYAVTVDSWRVEKKHLLLLIEVSLTKEGTARYTEVAKQIFSALNKIKKDGLPPYLHEDLYKERFQASEYVTPQDPFTFAIDAARMLVDEDLCLFPSFQYASSYYNENLSNEFLTFLDAKNCLFFLMAPQKEFPERLSQLERWMKTPYSVRKISKVLLNQWSLAEADQDFNVRPQDFEDEVDEEYLHLLEENQALNAFETIVDSSGITVRFANQIDEGIDSESGLLFAIRSPLFTCSARSAALSSLFFACFQRYLEEKDADNNEVWSLLPSTSEVLLALRQDSLIEQKQIFDFFSSLKCYRASKEEFEQTKEMFGDCFPGDPDPLDHAQNVFESKLCPSIFSYVDLFKEIQSISYEEFMSFHEQLFTLIHFDGIFFGGSSVDHAKKLWLEVEQILFEDITFSQEECYSPQSATGLWEDISLFKEKTHRKGHALLYVLNLGSQFPEVSGIQKVLSQLLQEEFFDELRTKQQTAYRVLCWPEQRQGELLHIFGLQSSTYVSDELYHRTNQFLSDFSENFTTRVSKDRMQLVKHTLIASYKRQKEALLQDSQDVSSINAAIDGLKFLTYEKVCLAAKELFSPKNTRRLVVLIEGN